MIVEGGRIQTRLFSHQSLHWQPLCSASLETSLHICSSADRPFSPTSLQAPWGAGPLWTSLNTLHTAGAQQLFVRHRLGSRKKRRGLQTPSKRGASSPPPEQSPARWLLPKARPSSALGNKYLYGDNYSIWGENPIKREPCRAANAGTEREAATPPSSRLLPIMLELPVPTALHPAPKSTAAPAGSLEQPGPPRASPLPQSGRAWRQGQGAQGIQGMGGLHGEGRGSRARLGSSPEWHPSSFPVPAILSP